MSLDDAIARESQSLSSEEAGAARAAERDERDLTGMRQMLQDFISRAGAVLSPLPVRYRLQKKGLFRDSEVIETAGEGWHVQLFEPVDADPRWSRYGHVITTDGTVYDQVIPGRTDSHFLVNYGGDAYSSPPYAVPERKLLGLYRGIADDIDATRCRPLGDCLARWLLTGGAVETYQGLGAS